MGWMCETLAQFGLTLKIRFARPNGIAPISPRAEWRGKQPELDPGKLVIIDRPGPRPI
jgi:hypothetical protein